MFPCHGGVYDVVVVVLPVWCGVYMWSLLCTQVEMVCTHMVVLTYVMVVYSFW